MKTKNIISLTALALMAGTLLFTQAASAQTCDSTGTRLGNQHLPFVDANGDGYNDNAPDHDGDGIPNGQDADYTRNPNGRGRGFVDADGDGINDNLRDHDGDGIPNGQDADYVRLRDGSGQRGGRGSSGRGFISGSCRGNRSGRGGRRGR